VRDAGVEAAQRRLQQPEEVNGVTHRHAGDIREQPGIRLQPVEEYGSGGPIVEVVDDLGRHLAETQPDDILGKVIAPVDDRCQSFAGPVQASRFAVEQGHPGGHPG
jgi:hypothetical protein